MTEPISEEKIDDACAFQHGTKVVRVNDVASAVQGLKEDIVCNIAVVDKMPIEEAKKFIDKEEWENYVEPTLKSIDRWLIAVVKNG